MSQAFSMGCDLRVDLTQQCKSEKEVEIDAATCCYVLPASTKDAVSKLEVSPSKLD